LLSGPSIRLARTARVWPFPFTRPGLLVANKKAPTGAGASFAVSRGK
jgi:hypothetical protein